MDDFWAYTANGTVVLLAVLLGAWLNRAREKENWARDRKLQAYADLDDRLTEMFGRFRSGNMTDDEKNFNLRMNLLVANEVAHEAYEFMTICRDNQNHNVAATVSAHFQLNLVREKMVKDLGVMERRSLRRYLQYQYNLGVHLNRKRRLSLSKDDEKD